MWLIWGNDRDAEMEKREMGGAFLFSCRKPPWCPGVSPHRLGQGWLWGWSLLLSRLCPHQGQGDRNDSPGPCRMPLQGCVQSWAGAGISREQHLQVSQFSSSAQTLQSKSAPHMALVSRLEGVTIPMSPQPVQQSPQGATMVHMFLFTYCMWAWKWFGAQQMLQGMHLTQGWGSSSTSLCPTKFNPQHLPSCQEERGADTPWPLLTKIPKQVHSFCQAEGRG